MLRVAVVGSGPSGVYTAQSLVQSEPGALVDVLDRLPCPYGLVRYGVAPDHEKIKSLQNNLRAVLEHERVRFLGGVLVGPGGLSATRLRELYDAVVYCVGAATDRQLGIPGEELPGSWSATEFVSWYSAHPDATAAGFVRGARSAVVIGVGNVAVDVTRILARGAAELSRTDIPQAALTALAASGITDVYMVGKRGPSQARFTTKELRELGGLPGTEVTVDPAELALDPDCLDPAALPAVRRRNVEELRNWAALLPGAPHAVSTSASSSAPSNSSPTRAAWAPCASNAPRRTDRAECGARVNWSTSRRSWCCARWVIAGCPWTVCPSTPSTARCRTGRAGSYARDGPCPVSTWFSWIKRGPTGVIGTNRPDAKETVTSLLADASMLVPKEPSEDPLAVLRAEGFEPVEWGGWEAIERAEAELGVSLGRGGVVKLPDWDALLAAVREART